MDQELFTLLRQLGDDALVAYIVYLCLDYGTVLLLIGVVTWGARAVWPSIIQ